MMCFLCLLSAPLVAEQLAGGDLAPAASQALAADGQAAPDAAREARIAGLIEALGYREQVARGMARMGTAAAQRRVERTKDRRQREQRLIRLRTLADRFEQTFNWDRIQPLMVASWQDHLDDRQVDALTAFLETEAGRLYASKGQVVINEAAVDQAIHLDAAIDAVFDRPPDVAPPRLPRVREPAPGSHAGLALRWLRLHDPAHAQVFAERKAMGLEGARTAFQAAADETGLPPEYQRILDAYEAEIRLADLEQIAVRRVVRELSRAELSILAEAFDTPAMQSLAAARARADRASGERLGELVQQEMAGGLMWELLRVTID